MRSTLRRAAACLGAGVLLGSGFGAATAVADSFTDVPPGNFFNGDIDWLTDYDIANGFADGTFDPNGNIKRQQAALWFNNYNSELESVEATDDPGPAAGFFGTADCPGDKRVVAGNGYTSEGDLVMTDSRALDDNTWSVRWVTLDGGTVDPTLIATQILCIPRDGTAPTPTTTG